MDLCTKRRVICITCEVVELDIGLSAFGVEIGAPRVEVDGLRVEIDGAAEVIVDECFSGLVCQIRRHCKASMETNPKRKRAKRFEQTRRRSKTSAAVNRYNIY